MPLGLKRNTVELVEHDPEWEKLAFQTIEKLRQVLGPVAKDIQHVGSTSIRHIKAKPMIDIAVAIVHFSEVEALNHELKSNGFLNRGWLSDEHMILAIGEDKESNDRLTTHIIHIVKADSKDWRDHIIFRDYLNACPSVAKAYETLKVKLASKYPHDEGRKRYADGKSSFINQALLEAAEWQRRS